MRESLHRRWRAYFSRMAVLFLIAITLAGCANVGEYMSFWREQRILEKAFRDKPSAEILKQLDPEDCYLLIGQVALNREYPKPLLLVAVTDQRQANEVAASRILQVPVLCYQAYLPEGNYALYLFADLDENGYFDAHEVIGRTTGQTVAVSKADVKDDLTVNGPALALDLDHPTTTDLPIKVQVREQGYAYDSLDDEFFDPKYGPIGLYEPKSFMAHTQRFFFSLGEFEPDKTVVVFVHGAAGTPRDFKYLVEGLDRTRYQPWFYFYPTGMPLQKLGSLLADIIRLSSTSREFQLQGRRVIVVAHSMGGLVALSGLNQLCADGAAPPYLAGYVSFDSPYGGVESAKTAVEKAPAVVASWRDLATGSAFLDRLYQGNATKSIPFYLFFGYQANKGSDGTIVLQSQLEPRVHFAAQKSYGFNATHVGILNDKAARQTFYQALETLETRP